MLKRTHASTQVCVGASRLISTKISAFHSSGRNTRVTSFVVTSLLHLLPREDELVRMQDAGGNRNLRILQEWMGGKGYNGISHEDESACIGSGDQCCISQKSTPSSGIADLILGQNFLV